jgi:hypothetical protein
MMSSMSRMRARIAPSNTGQATSTRSAVLRVIRSADAM